MKKVYQELAVRVSAYQNCTSDEWKDKHLAVINNILKNYLPSGSGLDSDHEIDLEKSNGEKIIIKTSFHNMDEHGGYDGWTDFKLIITPSLVFDYKMSIIGNFGKYQLNKEYIYDVFNEALGQSVKQV